MVITAINTPIIAKVATETLVPLQKYNNIRATKLNGGPGNTGITEPNNPIIASIIEKIISTISIC